MSTCLRPHHGMCFRFYQGKGYSSEFTEHMSRLIGELSADPSRMITLTVSADVVCERCPNNESGTCTSGDKAGRYDEAVLAACGLRAGDRIVLGNFMTIVKDRIIDAGLRGIICGDCEWNGVCGG